MKYSGRLQGTGLPEQCRVREYGRPVIVKVEGVNWTFGGGRAMGEAM